MRVEAVYIGCDSCSCIHNENGKCDLLTDTIEGDCPFFKNEVQKVLEDGALSNGDWTAFRRHSKTHPVTRLEIIRWLEEMEKISPTDDPKIKRLVSMLIEDDYITVGEAIKIVSKWFDVHPESRTWAQSSEEIAKEMFHRGDDDDETDETDAEVSDQYVSE